MSASLHSEWCSLDVEGRSIYGLESVYKIFMRCHIIRYMLTIDKYVYFYCVDVY